MRSRDLEDRIELNGLILDKGTVTALRHLEHFFSSLLISKEFWAAIVGAVVGGFLTGLSALYAQKQAANDQRRRDQEVERRAVNGILQAIAAELQVLKCDNFEKLQMTLNERQEATHLTPLAMTTTEQNYFIVFESNADAIGRINDEKLREDIIRVYGHAKGLVDSLNR
jgi:hypothetical protein